MSSVWLKELDGLFKRGLYVTKYSSNSHVFLGTPYTYIYLYLNHVFSELSQEHSI